jgi:hypothetical protein
VEFQGYQVDVEPDLVVVPLAQMVGLGEVEFDDVFVRIAKENLMGKTDFVVNWLMTFLLFNKRL